MSINLKNFYNSHKKLVCIGLFLLLFGIISWILGFNKKIITAALLSYGLGTELISALGAYLISLVGTIPWAGPLMVKIIMWPVFILINASLYLAHLLRIKKDSPAKFNKEAVSIVFTIGILIGFILAQII